MKIRDNGPPSRNARLQKSNVLPTPCNASPARPAILLCSSKSGAVGGSKPLTLLAMPAGEFQGSCFGAHAGRGVRTARRLREALSRRHQLVRRCRGAGQGMRKVSYMGYRFPPEVINQAIWLYLRFTLCDRVQECGQKPTGHYPQGRRRMGRSERSAYTSLNLLSLWHQNFAGAGPLGIFRYCSSLASILALALEERTGFRSEREHVCGRPHALRRYGRTLRPDNRTIRGSRQ